MTDSILIVGGGTAGLHAALECANAGAKTIVVERGPVVGGRLAAVMLKPDAIGDRSEGLRTPLFEALEGNENIEIITLAELENIEGRPGNFIVSVNQRARFVTDACTRCKNCHTVCPVVAPNEADMGLNYRKAIYTPMSDTLPHEWVIDIEGCLNMPPNYLPCQRCVEVCDDNAIFFNLPLNTIHERHVGAVILAPGFRTEEPDRFVGLGYGAHPDIVTSAELQRLLESPGPTGGFASKPSDEEYPDSVLLVLDNPSQFALYIVASQTHQLIEQDVEKVSVLLLAAPVDDAQRTAAQALADTAGIDVRWGGMFKADSTDENNFEISFEDLTQNLYVRENYDLVVLCSDVEPPDGLPELAKTAGIELSDDGYIRVNDEAGIATTREGVFATGCATGAKNIKDSLTQAQSAAIAAIAQLDPRQLQSGDSEVASDTTAESKPQLPPDMRQQIEQLLYALIDR